MKQLNDQSSFEILRKKAEEMLKNNPPRIVSELSESEMMKLIHELDVRQLELELQQEKLKESEQRLQIVLDVTQEAIWDFEISTGKVVHNTQWYTLLGAKPGEIADTVEAFGNILHPDDKASVFKKIDAVIQGKTDRYVSEHRLIGKEKTIWVQDRGTIVERDAQGNSIRMVGSFADITQRKQAEYELHESLKRFNILALHSRVINWEVDASGLYTYISDVCLSVLGYEPEEVIGKLHFYDFHPEQSREAFKVAAFEVFEVKKAFRDLESDVESRDGHIIWMLTNGMPILDDEGRLLGYRGTDTDITERKQSQEEIKLKNEELHKLNAQKDKFFSVIAHDLRSPFNVFLNFTRMLVDDLPKMNQEQIHKFAKLMNNSAISLFSLLENLLDWSRLQRGLITAHFESFPLMPHVNSSIESVITSANNKGIEISTNLSAELMVFADERMLDGILRNLITNALKFTPKGGKVIISSKLFSEKSVEFSIKDTGIGISREMIDNLFELDVNTSRKGTDGEPSTGLGLILCKEFVEKQGGRLWIESEEGNGSTFYFTIPTASDMEQKAISQNILSDLKEPKPAKKLKVLVVEDDEASKMIFTISLKKEGYEVIQAGSGVEAVEICRNTPGIDLVLMDINLPEMDGIEAMRQIRMFNKSMIIIAQTAYSNEFLDFGRKLIEVGCSDYLLKPVDNYDLKALIQKHFPI